VVRLEPVGVHARHVQRWTTLENLREHPTAAAPR
jgi:hypothetical protein